MGYLHSCLMCGEKIDSDLLECPHCGEKQYGENNEFYPDEAARKAAKKIWNTWQNGEQKRENRRRRKEPEEPVFTKNEVFFHAFLNENEDEEYRKFMRMNWFTRNYRDDD